LITLIDGAARVVGLYKDGAQIGFCRAATDYNSFVYLADVYVLGSYRGRGLGLELVREIVENSFGEVRWMLNTADAQGLYERLGFSEETPPYPLMERAPRRAASVEPRR